MRVEIEKAGDGNTVKVSLHYNTAKKPLVMQVTPEHLELALSVFKTAQSADKFKLSFEI